MNEIIIKGEDIFPQIELDKPDSQSLRIEQSAFAHVNAINMTNNQAHQLFEALGAALNIETPYARKNRFARNSANR